MHSDTPLSGGVFVAVDIETTGSTPGRNSIIELGAARIENGEIVAVFGELVRPDESIPRAVQLLTGISERMVAGAPSIEDVFRRFLEFAHGAVLVAHNYRFDLGFLDHHSETVLGAPFPRPVLDTLALAKRLHPDLGKYNLGLLASTYEVETVPTHRADADACATAEVFLGMLPQLQASGVSTVGEAARYSRMGGQTALARKLVLTTGLPDAPGVYLLKDARSRVIYVGRAKNLRLRLRSYFYVNADANGPRLGDETVSVNYIPCCSSLDAILLQSRLVDRYRPKHNVQNQRGGFVSLIHVDVESVFPRLKLTDQPRKTGVSLGPFVNRWAVESLIDQIREIYGLRRCASRITKRAGLVACEHRERGSCPAPCVGGIDPDDYQGRLTEALGAFDRNSQELRAEIVRRHEEALASGSHDEAIRYRDAVKAFDRALAGLGIVREATGRFGSVLMEAEGGCVTLHLVRYGYLVHTLRFDKEAVATGRCEPRIRRALHRAYFSGPYVDNPMEFTSTQLKDVFLIANHCQQTSPREIDVLEDEDATCNAVLSGLRRFLRLTRRRHVLTSTV